MNSRADIALALLLALLFAAALALSFGFPAEARLFPQLIAGTGLALTVLTVGSELLRVRDDGSEEPGENRVNRRRELTIILWIISYFAFVVFLGFQWGLPAIVALYYRFEGRLGASTSLLLAGVVWGLLFAAAHFLHLPLYEGALLSR